MGQGFFLYLLFPLRSHWFCRLLPLSFLPSYFVGNKSVCFFLFALQFTQIALWPACLTHPSLTTSVADFDCWLLGFLGPWGRWHDRPSCRSLSPLTLKQVGATSKVSTALIDGNFVLQLQRSVLCRLLHLAELLKLLPPLYLSLQVLQVLLAVWRKIRNLCFKVTKNPMCEILKKSANIKSETVNQYDHWVMQRHYK